MKLLLAFLLLAQSWVLAAGLPEPGTLDGLGMNIHFTSARPGELEMMAAAGVRWVRMDFAWSGIEHERGQYDWSAYEKLLADLDRFHMRAVLIFDYGNKLYGDERAIHGEEETAAFARWVAAGAAHFAGRGVVWEMWNEPNGGFWTPAANVQEYAAAALAASKAFRAAAPKELLVGPATSTIDLAFIEGCGKAGLFDLWDAVSVHPYRDQGPETAALEYGRLRRRLTEFRPLPILSGEWGYSSASAHFDAERQGKYLPREWLTNLANGIPLSIWYDWHEDGTNPKEVEHRYGSVEHAYHEGADPVYTPKPAYLAAQRLTKALAGRRFVKRLAVGGAADYVLLFEPGTSGEGAPKLAYWTTSPTPQRIESLGLTLTDDPQYADGGKKEELEAIPTYYPIQATIEPAGSIIRVRLENVPGEAFHGQARLIRPEQGEMTQPFELAAGEWEKTISFDPGEHAAASSMIGLEIGDGSHVFLRLPPRRYTPVAPEVFRESKVHPDGDPKIASEQTLARADSPQPPPSGSAEVLRLTYHMAAGWKFLSITPGGDPAIPGEPHAFGMWVFGDGQGGVSHLRLNDAQGQTWQPSGPRTDWKGWRMVEFPLSPMDAHWGGSGDGVIHYPLRWDSLFLLDKSRDAEASGEIYLASPVTIE